MNIAFSLPARHLLAQLLERLNQGALLSNELMHSAPRRPLALREPTQGREVLGSQRWDAGPLEQGALAPSKIGETFKVSQKFKIYGRDLSLLKRPFFFYQKMGPEGTSCLAVTKIIGCH